MSAQSWVFEMRVKTATGLLAWYMRLCGFKGWTSFWRTVYVMPGHEGNHRLLRHEAEHLRQIEALWAAADRYTSGYISGVAIGILTIGVMQQKPKALAVSAWSSAVWVEYYARKALITAASNDNHDFSSFGPIPHSVPELQEEAGL